MVDLASSIIGGANSAGNFTIETPQRVLFDARRSFQDFGDQTGNAPDWPMVAPFKEGWLAYQSYLPYSGSPASAGPREATLIRYNDLGQVLWQVGPDTTLGSLIVGGSDEFLAGNSTDILVKRPNGSDWDFHLLDVSADSGTYSLGAVAFSLDANVFEQINAHSGYHVAHKVTGGWIIYAIDLNGAISTVSVAGLDEDFALLGVDTTGTWDATESRPTFVPDWNGAGPAIVQRLAGSGGSIKVWDVAFDGTGAPVIGASSTTAIDQITSASSYRAALGDGMFDYEWSASGDPINWAPSDGTATFTTANPYDWLLEDFEDWAYRGSAISVISPAVTDWTNTVPLSSRYHSDRYVTWPHVVRHNWANWTTKTAGYVDFALALPSDATPGNTCSFGDCYSDADFDESCFAVSNPTNGKVFYWTIIYWRETDQTVGCGAPCGDNALISYWIAQLGEGETPEPETPSWVNFFNTEGVPDPDCPMLGSGESRVFLYDRGGTRKIAEIVDTTLVRWTRVRDGISKATVQVSAPRPECADVLRTVSVGRHELVIFRNGERVWEGPVTRTTDNGGIFEIVAEDICFYLARTVMHHAYDNRYSRKKSKVGPVTHRAQIILVTELQRKERLSPPVNILRFLDVRTHPKTTRTSRFTPAYASSVWEELDYMAAKLSLDYTAVGRRLLINDVHDTIGQTQMLTDKDFNNPLVITTYGRELATRSAVTDGEGHWAAVGGIDDYYGEWELLNTTYGEEVQPAGATPTAAELKQLQAEMASQAQRNLAGRYPVPAVVRVPDNTRLDPASPVTMDQLVPGVRIPIRATLAVKPMEQDQKLNSVTVEQTEAGEVVTVTMVAAPGSTPWDDSSETGADEEAVT